jgi:4-hydroxy-tetrahydrodipicolinate reductase
MSTRQAAFPPTAEAAAKRIPLALHGATGRMGKALLQALATHPQLQLTAALVAADSPDLGKSVDALHDGAPLEVTLHTLPTAAPFAVMIDFSLPAPSLAALRFCQERGSGIVIGTTGFSTEEKTLIRAAACTIPVLFSPNMSIGVHVLFYLVEQAAKRLSNVDIEILEAHHRHKVDAPSGTALQLGEIIAAALDTTLAENAIYGRQGHTGARPKGQIAFSTLRGGDIVGEHTVFFIGEGERLELTHKASSRLTFAHGALQAATWLAGRAPGLYSMADVLGLHGSQK